MKKGWEYKKLGEVISHLRTGLNPRTHFKLNTPDAESYYITVRELKGFTIEPDEKTDKVNSAAIKRINERSSLKIGDVLFSGTGTIGKTALVCELPENWNIKEGVYAMTPKHSELDSKYFIYYISSEYFLRLVNDKAAGTGVRSIPMKELVKLPIPIPPLSEQQSIVDYLDSAFAKIDAMKANAEKALNEAKALFQASLKEMLEPKEGWEEKKLGEVGTFIRGGNFSKKDFVEDGYPCIHYGQIHTKFGVATYEHISCVPESIVKKERCASKGDLVIAITSEDDEGSCKCTAWMADFDAYVGGHTAIFKHSLNPLFVSYYFKAARFQKDKLNYTHGFKVVEISPKDIAKIPICYPPANEQHSIATSLDSLKSKVDRLQENYEKISQECDALKQAILRQVFE